MTFAPYADGTRPLRFRSAGPDDAEQVAVLHADSWRRHYRGAYADSFLDGDAVADRVEVWSGRLSAPGESATVLAERNGQLAGFVHVVFAADPKWGSLVDNLHVHHTQRRTGIGTQLLSHAAQAVIDRASAKALYLWVLEQNTAAQQFYLATGAARADTEPVPPPGGDPTRLNGTPNGQRMTWPDASQFVPATR